jgi:hypothetical protein
MLFISYRKIFILSIKSCRGDDNGRAGDDGLGMLVRLDCLS